MASMYLESSVISYRAAKPSNNLVAAAHQQITHVWWEQVLPHHEAFVSPAVMAEIAEGDASAARERLLLAESFKMLEDHDEVARVAKMYLTELGIPRRAGADAVHLAYASVFQISYLVTWNCAHIANGDVIIRLLRANDRHGLHTPIIRTPEEFMEEGTL